MRTTVTFRSDLFPAYPGEEEGINPGLWGKRLVEYLAPRLREHGIDTGEPNSEDWGWYLPVRSASVRMALCCGHQDGDADEFLVFTDPPQPIVRKLLKKIDVTDELTRLVEAVDAILRAEPGIRKVTWE